MSEEKKLQEQLLSALLLGAADHMTDWTTIIFLVNHTGLLILDQTQTAEGNCTTFFVVTGHLVSTLQGCVNLRSGDRTKLLTKGWVEIQRQKR